VPALLEEFTAIHEELEMFSEELDSTSSLELEEFGAIHMELLEPSDDSVHDELETSSAEVLLPSSPQATIPNAVANTPNKPKYFIFPSLFILNIIEFYQKSGKGPL
jgi:hypothetical protein